MNWKLSETSKTVEQPTLLVGKLRKHQLAMFYKALCIERQCNANAFGFLADKAGTGKTAVIISLMLADKQVGNHDYKTMIITPQNISKQWVSEINKFSGGVLKVKEITYNDILDIETLGNLEALRDYDVFITTQALFESIMSSLSSNGNTIYRIVYDEIDTMNNEISTYQNKKHVIETSKKYDKDSLYRGSSSKEELGLRNKITWFVSASIFNLIDAEKGFCFLGKQISNTDLPSLFVKCNNDFIDKNLPPIEEEEESIYECDSIADSYSDLLSIEQIDAINSLSYDQIDIKNRKKVPSNEIDLLKMLITCYFTDIEDNTDIINDCKRKMKMYNVSSKDTTHPLAKMIDSKDKDVLFSSKLLNSFYNKSLTKDDDVRYVDTVHDKLNFIIAKLDNYNTENNKMNVLEVVLRNCKSECSNPKVLIFSDFQGSFKYIPALLDKLDLKYEDLCKGTSLGIDTAIKKYKESNTQVIFIQSKTDGCGLNLENTTHLIFLHRTDARLRDQIIGRAQRQGRTGVLKIVSLYNKNENIESESDSD